MGAPVGRASLIGCSEAPERHAGAQELGVAAGVVHAVEVEADQTQHRGGAPCVTQHERAEVQQVTDGAQVGVQSGGGVVVGQRMADPHLGSREVYVGRALPGS